jgi:hypothetical protein
MSNPKAAAADFARSAKHTLVELEVPLRRFGGRCCSST